jgi:hypothetical protein
MRNNDKTSAIDCGGYKLTFDVILSPMVRLWLLMISTGFNLKGGFWNRGDGDDGHRRRGRTWVIGMGMRGGGATKLI